MDQFVARLVGKLSVDELTVETRRNWARRTSWCWGVEPSIAVTGEIYDQVMIDGTYLPYGWCLLTAQAQGQVIAWQWCNRETKNAYGELLGRIPAPRIVVMDGHRAALRAVSEQWPTTRVQRCLVHVKRDIRLCTTTRPKLAAHKALWGLANRLITIDTAQEADEWSSLLQAFYDQHKPWLHERTMRVEVLDEHVPSWVRPNQTWWYTHNKARRAYNLLATLSRNGTLFTYLDPQLQAQATIPLAATTNTLEGGINAQIKRLVYNHRGLPPDHMKRAVEWWCYLHSPYPLKPHKLVKPHHLKPIPPAPTPQADVFPAYYDTGIDLIKHEWHQDLSIRKGTMR